MQNQMNLTNVRRNKKKIRHKKHDIRSYLHKAQKQKPGTLVLKVRVKAAIAGGVTRTMKEPGGCWRHPCLGLGALGSGAFLY